LSIIAFGLIFVGTLTPFIPLSLEGEGELYVREASPLFDSPHDIYSFKREGGKN